MRGWLRGVGVIIFDQDDWLRIVIIESALLLFLCTQLCTHEKLCTQKKTMYTKKTVYTKKTYVHKKKQKKTNVHFFFVYTNIRVNNFPLCKKACLWHALDSRFRTLASYSRIARKWNRAKTFFVRSHSPLKNPFLLRQKFLKNKVCGFSMAITRKCFYSCKPIWGGNLIVPPHLTPQIQCLPVVHSGHPPHR